MSNNKKNTNKEHESVKKKFRDTPPSVYEDPIPLEDLKEDEIDNKRKKHTKNTSSTEKNQVD